MKDRSLRNGRRRFLRAKAGQQVAAAGTRAIVCEREQQKKKVGFDSFTMAALAWMKLGTGCKCAVVGSSRHKSRGSVWLCALPGGLGGGWHSPSVTF